MKSDIARELEHWLPAVKKRWDISDEMRAKMVARLMQIVQSDDVDDADAIAAVRLLVEMEGQNQRDEHMQVDQFVRAVRQLAKRLDISLRPRLSSIAALNAAASVSL